MKTPTLLFALVALLLFVAVLFAGLRWMAPAPRESSSALSSSESGAILDQLEALRAELAEIRLAQESAQADREDLHRLVRDASGEGREVVDGVDAAVARWMEANLERLAQESGGEVADAAEGSPVTLAALLDRIVDPALGWEGRTGLWREIAEAGGLDEAVDWFEDRAESDPDDPQLVVELGHAYLQKVFEAGAGPEAGIWATKADKAFDQALELEPGHWEARFTKAVSLSHWPPVMGKQGVAIGEFETLVAQQELGAPQPGYEETYLMLGNLYQQTGKPEKAVEVWQKGLLVFPEDADLQGQLEMAEEH